MKKRKTLELALYLGHMREDIGWLIWHWRCLLHTQEFERIEIRKSKPRTFLLPSSKAGLKGETSPHNGSLNMTDTYIGKYVFKSQM